MHHQRLSIVLTAFVVDLCRHETFRRKDSEISSELLQDGFQRLARLSSLTDKLHNVFEVLVDSLFQLSLEYGQLARNLVLRFRVKDSLFFRLCHFSQLQVLFRIFLIVDEIVRIL